MTSELSDKDFRAAMIKMLQQTTTNILEVNEKLESSSKEIESLSKEIIKHKEEPNGSFQAENTKTGKKIVQWMDSTAECSKQRKESMN